MDWFVGFLLVSRNWSKKGHLCQVFDHRLVRLVTRQMLQLMGEPNCSKQRCVMIGIAPAPI
jgi:hypothetical protein